MTIAYSSYLFNSKKMQKQLNEEVIRLETQLKQIELRDNPNSKALSRTYKEMIRTRQELLDSITVHDDILEENH